MWYVSAKAILFQDIAFEQEQEFKLSVAVCEHFFRFLFDYFTDTNYVSSRLAIV